MRIHNGWYNDDGRPSYYVVKPLHNHCRQQLVMHAIQGATNRWYLAAAVCSCNATYDSFYNSPAWDNLTSTNKNASYKTVPLALEALTEIEQAIKSVTKGKVHFLYIDGADERRLRVYAKVLNKYNCGYKKSTKKSEYCNLPMLYKRLA